MDVGAWAIPAIAIDVEGFFADGEAVFMGQSDVEGSGDERL